MSVAKRRRTFEPPTPRRRFDSKPYHLKYLCMAQRISWTTETVVFWSCSFPETITNRDDKRLLPGCWTSWRCCEFYNSTAARNLNSTIAHGKYPTNNVHLCFPQKSSTSLGMCTASHHCTSKLSSLCSRQRRLEILWDSQDFSNILFGRHVALNIRVWIPGSVMTMTNWKTMENFAQRSSKRKSTVAQLLRYPPLPATECFAKKPIRQSSASYQI